MNLYKSVQAIDSTSFRSSSEVSGNLSQYFDFHEGRSMFSLLVLKKKHGNKGPSSMKVITRK